LQVPDGTLPLVSRQEQRRVHRASLTQHQRWSRATAGVSGAGLVSWEVRTAVGRGRDRLRTSVVQFFRLLL